MGASLWEFPAYGSHAMIAYPSTAESGGPPMWLTLSGFPPIFWPLQITGFLEVPDSACVGICPGLRTSSGFAGPQHI